jgi:hypothetical protein
MIAEAESVAGHGAAEQLRQQIEALERLVRKPSRRSAAWREASDLDRDEEGALLIHPQNMPAVAVWLHVHDQRIWAGMDGQCLGLDMGVALEFTRELAASARARKARRVDVLDTTARLRILAAEVIQLEKAQQPRQGRR